MSAQFTVLILTEDAAGWNVIRTIVQRSLHEIDPQAVTWPAERWVRPSDPKVAVAARGSNWKNEAHPDRRSLVRTIATHLLRRDGFVVFHFDGDETWSNRARSENVAKWSHFTLLVEQHIRQLKADSAIAARALSRLIRLTPFYCVESWLYLATPSLLSDCSGRHGGAHHAEIEERSRKPHEIEEVVAPWKVWCAGKAANDQLASEFPVKVAYELGRSFHETLERLMACADLVSAMKATRPEW